MVNVAKSAYSPPKSILVFFCGNGHVLAEHMATNNSQSPLLLDVAKGLIPYQLNVRSLV